MVHDLNMTALGVHLHLEGKEGGEERNRISKVHKKESRAARTKRQ